MHFKIGQLVKIIDAPDQPRWIKNYIGKVALIVDKTLTEYTILIEEKIYTVHRLDLEPLNVISEQ